MIMLSKWYKGATAFKFFPFFETGKPGPKAAWYWLLLIILVSIISYFASQSLIGSIEPPTCGLGDALQNVTSGINAFLLSHPNVANGLIIAYSMIGDIIILFLIGSSLKDSSIRPVLPLLVFLMLRQSLQFIVSLPTAPGLIWHDPGFSFSFSTYQISSDFYFSAYVGINILGNLELERYKIKWLNALGLILLVYQASADIVLRAHYTADLYTSIITAIFSYFAVQRFVPIIDKALKKIKKISPYLLLACIVLAVAGYFTAQHFIGKKPIPICVINDEAHNLLYGINTFLAAHIDLENVQLIVMNTILDLLTLFIIFKALWTRDIRPFFTLMIFFSLRQVLQVVQTLPIPPHTIWHYPGFPSLLQTYHISNDLYFSGHTGVSLIALLEMARFQKRWLTILGLSLFVYEIISVLSMQVHYTMDVFTAIVTVFSITGLSSRFAPVINRWLAR